MIEKLISKSQQTQNVFENSEFRFRLNKFEIDSTHFESYLKLCHPDLLKDQISNLSVPLLYLSSLSSQLQLQVLSQPNIPFGLLGSVNTRNEIKQFRDITFKFDKKRSLWVSDIQTLQSFFSPLIRYHKRGYEFDMITQIFDSSQNLCWQMTFTILAFARHQQTPSNSSIELKYETLTQSSNTNKTFNLESWMGRSYASLSGDFNPVHLSSFTARFFGFKTQIAHGLFVVARSCSTHLCPTLQPNKTFQKKKITMRFLRPIFLPGKVSIEELSKENSSTSTEHKTMIWIFDDKIEKFNIVCEIEEI